jgi:YD repeat-containing protein
MRRQASPLVTIGLFLAIVASLPAQGGSIRYVYDELGRLVGVIDQNGDAATYHYDAVGNLTSITRTGPTQLAVIEFTPNAGGIGGSITIHGTGFSATPSQNTVTLNGTAATVVSASANTLVVTIPSGATSGPLSITTPNGTIVVSFSVISITPAPTITNFSPTIGPAGTAVTINGTAFETTASMNSVSFNTSYATPGTTSATQMRPPCPPAELRVAFRLRRRVARR